VATEKQANKAREVHSDALAERGAHAVGIASGRPYGKRGFVVVAYVNAGEAHDIPDKVTTKTGDGEISVAVVKKVAERFQPE